MIREGEPNLNEEAKDSNNSEPEPTPREEDVKASLEDCSSAEELVERIEMMKRPHEDIVVMHNYERDGKRYVQVAFNQSTEPTPTRTFEFSYDV